MRRLLLPLLLSVVAACGAPGPGDAGVPDAGFGDFVLDGRWTQRSQGLPADTTARAPRIEARFGEAHLVYVTASGAPRYLILNGAVQRELPLPAGLSGEGRVALSSFDSTFMAREVATPEGYALWKQKDRALQPLRPTAAGLALGTAELGSVDGELFLAAHAEATHELIVERNDPTRWYRLGAFPLGGSLRALHTLVDEGAEEDTQTLFVATVEGPATRVVRQWYVSGWRELGSPPAADGEVSLTALAGNGDTRFLLEYQAGARQSVVWAHDGTGWVEYARSEVGEQLHGLAWFSTALYTLTSTPGAGTTAIARVQRGKVTRVPLVAEGAGMRIDGDPGLAGIDPASTTLLSREGQLFWSYQTGPAEAPQVRLYQLLPR